MNSSLSKGARGDKVKELQKMLIDGGYLDSQYVTGYFGDLTEKALKAFQSKAGIQPSGSFDDVTSGALKNFKGAELVSNHPNIVGTPLGEYMQSLKQSNPGLYYTIAGAAQNGVMITPGMLKNAEDQAKAQLEPYYAQDAQNQRGILDNYLSTTLGKYQNDLSGLRQQASSDFNTLNDQEGQSGTWASSARGERMNSLQNKYNTAFQNLKSGTQGDIYSKLQSQEYNYGAGALPNVSLDSTQVDFSTPAPSFSAVSSQVYNPFNFAGRKNAEKSANVADFTNNTLSSQFYPLSVKTNN